jgi:hypothetical protein
MAVPVLSSEYKTLYPTTERRARRLMERGDAKPYWRKGVFCILLLRKESDQREKYKDVVVGIDTGSKREGYTVATEKSVVLNITTNTPEWVKGNVETRRTLRRSRRQRKTPYRKCRSNRSKKVFLPPSTKARWNCKLRILKLLTAILPITKINIEDVAAKTLENSPRWNKFFSPLEVGKTYFYNKIEELYPNIILIKTKGFDTKTYRDSRGFVKSTKKLDYIWEAHNIDSHSLCEIVLEKTIFPFYGMYRIDFLKYYRRQLHYQNPIKGNIRKKYGSTVSLGISRGSLAKYKTKLVYVGGTSNGRISIHSIITGERLSQVIKKEKLTILNNNKYRTQFLPQLNQWISLRKIR